jgi:hypothetical protein
VHFNKLNSNLFLAACLASVPVMPAYAGNITDITTAFTVGIDDSGVLYGDATGFRRNSDFLDPLVPGTPRDSWGASANGVAGYADPQAYGIVNIVANGAPTFGANTAFISSFLNDGLSNFLRIDQTYTFAAPNILKINTQVTNVSGSTQSVMFQRNVDWDFGDFLNFTAIDALPGFVIDGSYYGFESPDPNNSYSHTSGPGGGTYGPDDIGAGIKINLGALADGSSAQFDYFYGLSTDGQTPNGLRSQAIGLGAAFVATSYSADGDMNSASQSAILAIGEVPEPGSVTLFGGGFLGLILYVRRGRNRVPLS